MRQMKPLPPAKVIADQLAQIDNEEVRRITIDHINDIDAGQRDFRF